MKIKLAKPSEIPQSWYGKEIGFDIESDDKTFDANICMVSLYSPEDDVSLVIGTRVYRQGELELISEDELDILKKFLGTIKAVGHFLQYDLSFVQSKWGVKMKVGFDTFILSRMLQMDTNGLKDIYMRLFPEKAHLINKFGDVLGEAPWAYNIDDKVVVQYSGLDAALPFRIRDYYAKYIGREDTKRILDLEFSFLETAADIRANGINVDLDKFHNFNQVMKDEYEQKRADFSYKAGFAFRCNSSADIEKILVDGMGLVPPLKTKTGKYSMSSECLEMMADMYDNVEVRDTIGEILDLKHIFSVVNSIKKVPTYLSEDNKFHPTVEQIGYDGTSRVYCLTGDNKIVYNGVEMAIEEVHAIHEMGYVDSLGGPKLMTHCWRSGIDDIYEVTLEDGKSVRCNGDHPFAVDRDGEIVWVKAKDLTEQDNVVTR